MKLGIESREKELTDLVTKWAQDCNFLIPGEIIEVSVRIINPPLVTVKIDGYHGPADIDLMPITELDFSVRTVNCLANANLTTVGAIRQKTLDDVLKHRNFGRKSAREIQQKLAGLGVDLGWFPK